MSIKAKSHLVYLLRSPQEFLLVFYFALFFEVIELPATKFVHSHLS